MLSNGDKRLEATINAVIDENIPLTVAAIRHGVDVEIFKATLARREAIVDEHEHTGDSPDSDTASNSTMRLAVGFVIISDSLFQESVHWFGVKPELLRQRLLSIVKAAGGDTLTEATNNSDHTSN